MDTFVDVHSLVGGAEGVVGTLYATVKIAVAGYALYCVVSMVYNVTLHPLAVFPGPLSWGASRWPSIWRLFKGCLVRDVHALHEQFGHVVRIAPNELAFSSAQAWKDIYGHKRGDGTMKEMPKFHRFYSGISKIPSIVSEPTHDGHRFIRRLLSPAFSDKNLRELEPIVQGYIGLFIRQLRARCSDSAGAKTPIDLVSWYNSATFDIVGDLTFGRSFGSLERGEEDPFVKDINQFAALGGAMLSFTSHFPGRGVLRWLAGLSMNFQNGQERHVMKMQQSLSERIDSQSSRPDLIDVLVREKDGIRIDKDRVLENAAAITMAGSETTASQLSGVTALLLQNPDCLARLIAEVRSAFQSEEDITSISVASLDYLQACLDEGLRCYPPVAGGLLRVVPEGGNLIDGERVPENTLVSVWQYSANHSTRNFAFAAKFRPERWLKERNQSMYGEDRLEAMQAFSVGSRDCVGRNLAKNEARLILARLLYNFDIELVHKNQNWLDHKVYVVWHKPSLDVYLTPIEHAGR